MTEPRIILGPAAEPIHLAEATLALRAGDDEDDFITRRIRAARETAEHSTGRALVTQTRELALPAFPYNKELDRVGEPRDRILLPGRPLQSVVSIVYVDEDGVSQTLDSSKYQVDTDNDWVRPAYDEEWPSTRDVDGAVLVRYRCGEVTVLTADNSTNKLTAKGCTFSDGGIIRLSNSGGALPAGLATYTDYYVVNASGAELQVALTAGGAAVAFTDDGTGTHFAGELDHRAHQLMHLLLGHFFENREAEVLGTITSELKLGVQSLIRQLKVYRRT